MVSSTYLFCDLAGPHEATVIKVQSFIVVRSSSQLHFICNVRRGLEEFWPDRQKYSSNNVNFTTIKEHLRAENKDMLR